MSHILERGYFDLYNGNSDTILRSKTLSMAFSQKSEYVSKPMVFMSHKHSDLPLLQNVIEFFKTYMGVEVYIDSDDDVMPSKTCNKTAVRIKNVIRQSHRFILLATEAAIASQWCNWELGIGDILKFPNKMAILPIKENGTLDSDYKGNEYLSIYPHILRYNGDESDFYHKSYSKGYYVVREDGFIPLEPIPLKQWLQDEPR